MAGAVAYAEGVCGGGAALVGAVFASFCAEALAYTDFLGAVAGAV